jgi:PII-like signaling protein
MTDTLPEVPTMFTTMCALRIYLRRGDQHEGGGGFWSRLFRRPLAKYLLNESFKAGVTHASLTHGNMGFAKGDKLIAADVTEIGFDALPVCIEIVAPRPLVEQFVRDHQRHLKGATVMMLEGIQILPHAFEESDTAGAKNVEYLRVGEDPEAPAPRAPEAQVRVAPEADS